MANIKQTAVSHAAITHLGITLALQGSDSLDFHDLHVKAIERALSAAYEAGVLAAKAGRA